MHLHSQDKTKEKELVKEKSERNGFWKGEKEGL